MLKPILLLIIISVVSIAPQAHSKEVGPALKKEQTITAQNLLARAGYDPGPVDGAYGKRTEAALMAFLKDNGYSFDGTLSDNELEILSKLPSSEKYRKRQRIAGNRPVKHTVRLVDGLVTFPDSWELPTYLSPPPDDIALEHYFDKWLSQRPGGFIVEGSKQPTSLVINPIENHYVGHQLKYNSVLSYILYEEGEVTIDQVAPPDRFDRLTIDNATPFRSQSVGKSVISYLVGHAICEGYISGFDSSIDDWPLIKNTAYENQKLIDLLNMRAGDQNIVNEDVGFVSSGRWFNNRNKGIADHVNDEILGTKPDKKRIYNYNGFVTNILMNYVIFKTGDDWQQFLDKVFQQHVRIEQDLVFMRSQINDADRGIGWYMFYATRYDYLRIAIAMLQDWNSDTCMGDYLRYVYKNRGSKGGRAYRNSQNENSMAHYTKSYGGQFLLDFIGLEDRVIFGMEGHGGQNVLIDMDNARIVVINSAHTNMNWKNLAYEPLRTGTLPK